MIKVNNVVKTFEGFRALDGLTMTCLLYTSDAADE